MCYSALVKQNLKQLSFQFKARIDNNAFKEMFAARLEGQKVIVSKSLEHHFTENPTSPDEKQIRDLILEYRNLQQGKDEQDLFKQQKRLADAEQNLKSKPTKKATEDQRIALKKIDWYKERMQRRSSTNLVEGDFQIFPFHYAPVVRSVGNELIIEPRRYHLRPKGQQESFDRKYNGCYNAREDNLDTGAFWKDIFGRNHALMVIHSFFENVPEHLFKQQQIEPGGVERNVVLRFSPKGLNEMYIPCLFDDSEDDRGWSLKSFALITTNPPPEVAATGHSEMEKSENLLRLSL